MKQKPWEDRKNSKYKPRIKIIRKKYLTVTEGATEAGYLSHFKTSTGPELLVINGLSNKLGLVKRTIAERDKRLKTGDFIKGHDVAWVVMDRDIDPSNPKDRQIFNEALRLAEAKGIKVAYSNDSFELWYLLHFQEVSGPLHRREIDKKLSEHLQRTYKSRHRSKVEDLFEVTRPSLEVALKRAESLMELQLDAADIDSNPCTTVHLLLKDLMAEEGFRLQ